MPAPIFRSSPRRFNNNKDLNLTENDLDYVNKFLEESDTYNLFSQSIKYNEQDFINFKMYYM